MKPANTTSDTSCFFKISTASRSKSSRCRCLEGRYTAFSPRARARSIPGAVSTLLITTAIFACNLPDSIWLSMAWKLEPRPERRMPSLRLAGWILICCLFFQACFPQIELAVFGFGIRYCVDEIDRILARIAGSAEFIAPSSDSANQSRQAKITKRVRFNICADFLDGVTRRNQLFFSRSIDTVETRRQGRRATNPHMHFLGAGRPHHFHDLAACRPPDNRVVDQHHALARKQIFDGIQFHFDTEMADLGFRLYKRASHVMVSNQSERE